MKIILAAGLILLSVQVASAEVFRMVPGDDYGTLPANNKNYTNVNAINATINAGKRVDAVVEDNLGFIRNFLDLHPNFSRGGNRDIVIQNDESGSRVEVFVCPTQRRCVFAEDQQNKNIFDQGRTVARCADQPPKTWTCEQLLSIPNEKFAASVSYQEGKTLFYNWVINAAIVSAVKTPITFLHKPVLSILGDIFTAGSAINLGVDIKNAALKSVGIPSAPSPTGGLTYVTEKDKWDLVTLEYAFTTRNVDGARADLDPLYYGSGPLLQELSYGDRSRQVTLDPSTIASTGRAAITSAGPLSHRFINTSDEYRHIYQKYCSNKERCDAFLAKQDQILTDYALNKMEENLDRNQPKK